RTERHGADSARLHHPFSFPSAIMSGFAAIAHSNSRLISEETVAKMARALQRRGPDEQHIWSKGGSLAIVHALFQTTEDNQPRTQPFSFDGVIWIAADARLDARDQLTDRLRAHGCEIQRTASDAELILHAFYVWDRACAQQMLGDFSFVIV